MKNLELNFWKAIGIYALIQFGLYGIIYITIRLVFKVPEDSEVFYVSMNYLSILTFLPVVLIAFNKQGESIKACYQIKDPMIIVKMLVIVLLVRFIVLIPLNSPLEYFSAIKDSKLGIISLTTRPLFPLLDFRVFILVPIIEELFFRGFVLRNFLKKYSPLTAILLSSLLFALHHQSVETFLFHFSLGVVFDILYYTSRSLTVSTLAHIIFNTLTIFRSKVIELDSQNSITYLAIYIVSTYALVILLRKDFKQGAS